MTDVMILPVVYIVEARLTFSEVSATSWPFLTCSFQQPVSASSPSWGLAFSPRLFSPSHA